jgi:hypothetical protein
MTTSEEIQARLQAASAAVREWDLLTARRASLKREYEAVRELATDRRARLLDEQADVEGLESFSLARIVAGLRGSRDADLDRERAEVEAARLRLAETQAQRDALKTEVEAVSSRLARLGDVDREYRDAVEAKETWLAAQGGVKGRRIAALAEDRGRLLAERRELAEAVEAATTAGQALRAFDALLGRAERWSIYDTYFGGGLIASEIKLEKLDHAAGFAAGANRALARLSEELADVGDGTVSELSVDDSTRFFDMWSDNVFADLSVQARIEEAKRDIARISKAVSGHRSRLDERLRDLDDRLQRVEKESSELLG